MLWPKGYPEFYSAGRGLAPSCQVTPRWCTVYTLASLLCTPAQLGVNTIKVKYTQNGKNGNPKAYYLECGYLMGVL